ncbi:MAG: SGNH/GDSL hydrolase family protein [Actinophytocola sp.]|nr:SGNH/GDSL hydrolase family protein [Actinophytocola sp.]
MTTIDESPVPTIPTIPACTVIPARSLAVLGDSTAVGLGDPLPDGSWRGVGPLIAEALGIDRNSANYLNTSFTGARMACVRTDQLPAALRLRPDVTVIVVGMNDTLRSDFDAGTLAADLDAIVTALQRVGSVPLMLRFHDHARVFRLPRPLARALRDRIAELNDVIDLIVARRGVGCFDVGAEEGTYQLCSWSVDRLHPSEFGHRILARGFTRLIADAGFAVPAPVSLQTRGGKASGTADHIGWLIAQGIPWLWRRGRDLVPYAASMMVRTAARAAAREVSLPRGPEGY